VSVLLIELVVLSVLVLVFEFPLQAEKTIAAAIMDTRLNFFIKIYFKINDIRGEQNMFHELFKGGEDKI
jgi:hypothetical protein